MASNSEARKITYFQPGQIVFHVSGDWNLWAPIEKILIDKLTPPVIDHVKKWSGRSAVKLANNSQPNVTFSQSKLVKFSKSLTLASYDLDLGSSIDPPRLLGLVVFLDTFRGVANIALKSLGVKLEAVSLNWLMSGGSKPGATGGPGGVPSRFQGTIADPGNLHEFKISSALPPLDKDPKWGDNVVVGVFDTVPPPDIEVSDIYRRWAADPNNEHPLIKSLCNPVNPRLTIHRYGNLEKPSNAVGTYNIVTKTDDPPPGFLQPEAHNTYKMTDHGLFAAGIIHSLAPMAEIHLYQVLNPYGVGDILSVTEALKDFYDAYLLSNKPLVKPLVVNLSLTLNLPIEDGHIMTNDLGVGRQILRLKPWPFVSWICTILNRIFGWSIIPWFDRQAQSLKDVCDSLNGCAHVIAAAGNDRKSGQPQARYPAAFESVLGVGALRRFDPTLVSTPPSAASYSNLSDRPKETGITTLGGENGAGQGVLGIYIGDFPPIENSGPTTPSQNGWAWWCGTSFATPIISGVIAIALTNASTRSGTITNRAKEVINQLIGSQVVGMGPKLVTQQNEDVLSVTQGPP